MPDFMCSNDHLYFSQTFIQDTLREAKEHFGPTNDLEDALFFLSCIFGVVKSTPEDMEWAKRHLIDAAQEQD